MVYVVSNGNRRARPILIVTAVKSYGVDAGARPAVKEIDDD